MRSLKKRKALIPKYEKITLENGFEVYFAPVNEKSGVISVDLYYKVGSRDETLGKTGIAHMLEHMNFKSTKKHKAGEFDRIVKSFGGVDNASTGFDFTHYYIKCEKSNLDKSLELFSDMMENLALKKSEFEPERNVVAEERRWRTDNDPMGFLYFKLFESAFGYHPYHWLPIGFYDDIINWDINDIKDFHKRFYQPQNAFLMISGASDAKTAFSVAKKHFGSIKNKSELPKRTFSEPEQKGAKEITIIKPNDSQICALAFKTPNFAHADVPALDALAQYLGDGKSSLLQKELVDSAKLATSISCFNMALKDAGLFIIIAIANPKVRASKLKSEILKLIKSTKSQNIDESYIEKIKNSLKIDLEFQLSSASSAARLVGEYIANGDISPLYSLEERTAKLAGADINKMAKKYLNQNQMTSVILKGR